MLGVRNAGYCVRNGDLGGSIEAPRENQRTLVGDNVKHKNVKCYSSLVLVFVSGARDKEKDRLGNPRGEERIYVARKALLEGARRRK